MDKPGMKYRGEPNKGIIYPDALDRSHEDYEKDKKLLEKMRRDKL